MMKALLIVSALSGGMGTYEVEMPSMNECLEARIAVMEQDTSVKLKVLNLVGLMVSIKN